MNKVPAEAVGIGVGVPNAGVAGTNSLKLQAPRSGFFLFSAYVLLAGVPRIRSETSPKPLSEERTFFIQISFLVVS
jgi:hypothetical protein